MIKIKDIVNKKVYDEDIVEAICNAINIKELDSSKVLALAINNYPIINKDCIYTIDDSHMCDIIAEAKRLSCKHYLIAMDTDDEIMIVPF